MKKVYTLNDDHTLKVNNERFRQSPDTWENKDCFIVYEHRQFTIKRDGFDPAEIFAYENIANPAKDFSEYTIYPLYAHIHSDVSLSLSRGTNRFDTSSTGYLLIKHGQYPVDTDLKVIAESLVKTWNTYLCGEVYYFKLEKHTKCEHCGHIESEIVDARSDFYGEDIFTNGILDYMPANLIVGTELDKTIKS